MASIGGLSGTTSSSLNGLKGYGGLASGLDRDSLIEGMTQGTTSKIYKQQQKKKSLPPLTPFSQLLERISGKSLYIQFFHHILHRLHDVLTCYSR